jgi:hypothetical protein
MLHLNCPEKDSLRDSHASEDEEPNGGTDQRAQGANSREQDSPAKRVRRRGTPRWSRQGLNPNGGDAFAAPFTKARRRRRTPKA